MLNLGFFGLDQELATNWSYNWFPGLILGAFCTIFRACPVGVGLGAKFGREMTEKDKTSIVFVAPWFDCHQAETKATPTWSLTIPLQRRRRVHIPRVPGPREVTLAMA